MSFATPMKRSSLSRTCLVRCNIQKYPVVTALESGRGINEEAVVGENVTCLHLVCFATLLILQDQR